MDWLPVERAALLLLLAALPVVAARRPPERPPDTAPDARVDPETARFAVAVMTGFELGPGVPEVVRRWTSPMRIELRGAVTDDDRGAATALAAELSRLARGLEVRVVPAGQGNVQVHFAPRREFPKISRLAIPGNPSLLFVRWHDPGVIDGGTVLIDAEAPPAERAALLREELAQALGVTNASLAHPESVFYDGPGPHPRSFAPIDEVVIGLLYDPAVRPGMTRRELREWLAGR